MTTASQQVMAVIRKGNLPELDAVLARFPNLAKRNGPRLLVYAAHFDHRAVLKALVAAGADINGAVGNYTPLIASMERSSLATVRWLLDNGAQIDHKTKAEGITAIEAASFWGRFSLVNLLLDRGAGASETGEIVRSALRFAKHKQRHDIVALLRTRVSRATLEEPASVNVEAASFLNAKSTLNPQDWLDLTWVHVCEYQLKHGLDALGEKNRVLFFAGYYIDQMAKSGVEQFLYSPAAAHSGMISWALEKIGAKKTAAYLDTLNSLFPGGSPPVDEQSRAQQLKALNNRWQALGTKLEKHFAKRTNDDKSLIHVQLYDFWHA